MMSKLASFDNDIDFPRLWRIGFVISAVLILVSVGAFIGRGLSLGIDFEGGTSWEVPAPDATVAGARDQLRPLGEDNAKIQILGGDTLRVQSQTVDEAGINQVADVLAAYAGIDESEIGISTVGPTWGDEISEKAQRALVFFFIIISLYMAVRLEWKMALGALLAVVHDIVITVGVYSVFGFEVTPATVIAILTILGYSMYDTIIVFDKARDNMERPSVAQRYTYTDLMSLSLNQVLMRSLNTSITSLLPVLAMLLVGSMLLGAVTLQEFAVALAVGLVLGAYSSIFIATPFVAWFKEREPYYRGLRSRLESQQARRTASEVHTAAAERPVGVAPKVPSKTVDRPDVDRIIPPRPRKKGKRR